MGKQTLSQATRKANQNVNSIDGFGTGKENFFDGEDLSKIENVIGEFIKRVKDNLQSSDMIVTGQIEDIQMETEGSTVSVFANPWLDFQDKGVNGSKSKLYTTPYSFKNKKPPVQPFIQWAEKRGLQDKKGDSDSVGYAIRETVFQKGLKPRNVYSKELPKLLDDLEDIIGSAAINVVLKNIK